MLEKQIIQDDQIPRSVVTNLEKRDVALWIGALPQIWIARPSYVSSVCLGNLCFPKPTTQLFLPIFNPRAA